LSKIDAPRHRNAAALFFARHVGHSARNDWVSNNQQYGEDKIMNRVVVAGASLLAAALLSGAASAEDTIKIGVISAYSGQFADTANQIDNGIKLYMKQHGDKVAGKKIEVIRKDTGGPNPDVAKRLAQELIVRDKVDILAGFTLTPEALGAASVSAEAKKLLVDMNAATAIITTKSPYIVRVSLTLPQITETLGNWAATKGGAKKAYTMVSDFGPGIDAEQGFQKAFKAAGGEIVGSVRMPIANPDFSAFIQRAKDLNPESIFVFVPGGAQPAAIGKAFAERGIDPNKVKIMSTGEAVDEQAVKAMGDLSVGRLSAWHYDYNHKSKMNADFVKAFNAEFKRNPDFFAVGGYDGMHLIYEALKKTGGKADGDSLIAAAKGMKWESPRGPISIDPETRDIVQNVYIRKVEKVGANFVNVEFDTIANVKDPTHGGK
jgi:branched-chain amino acid transport system substrate-binding protein